MRFWLKWFLSAWLFDHAAAFTRNFHKNRDQSLICTSILQADYLKSLESSNGGLQSSSDYNYSPNYSYSSEYNPQSPNPNPPGTDDGRPTYVLRSRSSTNQDFSYLQDWNHQANYDTNYLNQLSGSPTETTGPTSRYLDNPTYSAGPGISSYTDSLSSTNDADLFFLQQKEYLAAPSSPDNYQVDPFSGFPIATYSQYPSSTQTGDDWQREITYLKETVYQLSKNLSVFSSQLASVVSAQTTPSPLPTMAEVEEKFKAQFQMVMDAQSAVSKQLEDSIAELRASLSKQEQSIQGISQRGQEDGQRVLNLSQTVTNIQTTISLNQANQQRVEDRLMALENRLVEQQVELRTASTRTDPRVMAMEVKLQEQADLLKQAMANPEARISALEIKMGQLQQEIVAASTKPESRVEALETKMKEQQARFEAAASQPDPRIAMLEEKMKVQEEQIRAAKEAISNAKIAALRARLIEQQERLEAATNTRKTIPIPPSIPPTTPTPFPWENPFGSTPVNGDAPEKEEKPKEELSKSPTKKDGKSKWLPWGQPWKAPKASSEGSSPRDPPSASESQALPLPDNTPLQKQPTKDPAPAFGSYKNLPKAANFSGLNGAFQGLPFGKSQGITTETSQKTPSVTPPPASAFPFVASFPSTSPVDTVGTFQGSAFGRSKGISVETPGQERPRGQIQAGGPVPSTIVSEPQKANGRSSPPPSVVKSDQDLWDPERPNPDAVKRPLIEYPKNSNAGNNEVTNIDPPIVPSDQDRWDPDRPNPDAVKRPLIDFPKSTSTERKLAKISSDQDLWDPDKPNPDVVKRPLVEKRPTILQPPPKVEPRTPYQAKTVDPSNQPSLITGRLQRDASNIPISQPINGNSQGNKKVVTSDQGRWDSAAQVKRDIDDMRSAASRPKRLKPPTAPTSGKEDSDLFRKSKLLSAYLEWCQSYGRDPSEERFEHFSRNYAKLEAASQRTGRFPTLNAFADYSEEEFAKMNAAGGWTIG